MNTAISWVLRNPESSSIGIGGVRENTRRTTLLGGIMERKWRRVGHVRACHCTRSLVSSFSKGTRPSNGLTKNHVSDSQFSVMVAYEYMVELPSGDAWQNYSTSADDKFYL